ncbi:MAG: ATP synthase F1 subunit delta [Acidobacteriota bacterium]
MKNQVLIKKYTQGLVGALRDEPEFAAVSRELSDFQNLVSGNAELAKILASPFVPARKKAEVIKDILAASGFLKKTSRFLLVLLDHNRLDLLHEIREALPVLWNEHCGVATFEVSSAVPLGEVQKKKLKAELERREKSPVYLIYRIDPTLVGGFSLKRGNVVYDASLTGRLAKLKEKISEG